MTALSAAHGYAMITRRPQVVLVHVDVGTQNLGCSIHNAARGRVPAIIVAGLSPLTDGLGRTGERNEFIHYIQDAPRQHEIAGQFLKWAYELRAPETVDAVMLRALQMATLPPEGPVYVTAAREIWESAVPGFADSIGDWPAAQIGGIQDEAAAEIYDALGAAERPVVITSYLGRQADAVERLVALSERLGIGVCEVSPQYLSFPGGHPHHLGYRRNRFIDEADLILMLDVDVPWIRSKVRPAPQAKVFHIDIDPLKENLGFWHFPAQRVYRADSRIVLDQLLELSETGSGLSEGGQSSGYRQEGPPDAALRRRWRMDWIAAARNRPPEPVKAKGERITPEELTEAVRELIDERTIVLAEEPSSTELIPSILRLNRAGSFYSSGGSGLGWGINAAIGVKLARPDSDVIALVGDGCYLFGVPSSAYWVAGAYGAPHLSVIYNNGGWRSPKLSTEWVHPGGAAERNDTYWATIGAGARLAEIGSAAGGASGFRVAEREGLKATLHEALRVVRSGCSAVVEVMVTPASKQVLG
jgi:acetolactate synthase-1/2/3 large subunit